MNLHLQYFRRVLKLKKIKWNKNNNKLTLINKIFLRNNLFKIIKVKKMSHLNTYRLKNNLKKEKFNLINSIIIKIFKNLNQNK